LNSGFAPKIPAMSLLFSYFEKPQGNLTTFRAQARVKTAWKGNMAQGTLFSYFSKVKKVEEQTLANSREWMKPGELVWAKMEGYPYWPAMLTSHHLDHKMLRGNKNNQECHVQFFGEPQTRGWVLVRYALNYHKCCLTWHDLTQEHSKI